MKSLKINWSLFNKYNHEHTEHRAWLTTFETISYRAAAFFEQLLVTDDFWSQVAAPVFRARNRRSRSASPVSWLGRRPPSFP